MAEVARAPQDVTGAIGDLSSKSERIVGIVDTITRRSASWPRSPRAPRPRSPPT
jgi:hypothetical protein